MAAEAGLSSRPLVVSIVGTRPEAIKMLPVVRALADLSVEQHVVLTGQHRGLDESFASLASLTLQDLKLDVREQTPGEICEAVHHALCPALLRDQPALVLVQGDTSSALGGALAAHDCAIPLGHVEAGLRSFDLADPWPEEKNRILIDRLADLLFAPTEAAAANLAVEGLRGTVHVTGNSCIDALFDARTKLASETPASSERRTILVTCHRRENRGRRLDDILQGLRRLVAELPVEILFPLHPNPHVRPGIERQLAGVPHIHLLPPAGYAEMVGLIERCWLILTDSGGLQEEGPALGRPVLVLRDVTERVEASESSRLVGTRPDHIVAEVAALLVDETRYARMARPSLAYGDGRAGPRIAGIIRNFLGSAARQAIDEAQPQVLGRQERGTEPVL